MINWIVNFIHNIGPNIAANNADPIVWFKGVSWINNGEGIVMMNGYDGWWPYIADLFNNLGFIEIFLIVASALLWTGVYIVIIKKLYQNHAPSMPWVCLCMNFSWEFQFAFLVPYPEPVTRWGIYLWVVFDFVMYVLDLKYGKYAFRQRWGEEYGQKKYYYSVKVGLFVLIFIAILAMNPQWPELPESPMYAAYIMNTIMSMLFITHMFTKETIEGTSIYQAWFKFLGTVAPSVLGFMWMPGNYFVYVLAIMCAIFDVIYIIMLTDRYHKFGVNPYTGKAIAGKEDIYADTQKKLAEYKEKSAAFQW